MQAATASRLIPPHPLAAAVAISGAIHALRLYVLRAGAAADVTMPAASTAAAGCFQRVCHAVMADAAGTHSVNRAVLITP